MRATRISCCFALAAAACVSCPGDTSAFHNSLFIRDRLRQANRDPLYLERREGHRAVCRDPQAAPSAGDVEMKGRWRVAAQAPQECATTLREDITDFLRRMGVEVADTAEQSIRLRTSKDLEPRAFRVARYGVRFTYVPVGAKLRPSHPVFRNHPEVGGALLARAEGLQFLCSSSETTLKFYEELFGNLLREVPPLAGVVLITCSESWYHCRMWDRSTRTPCRRCAEIPVNDMTARFVEAVDRGQLQEESDLAELLYRTFLTCANTVDFLRARRASEKAGGRTDIERMREIAQAERANTAAAIPLYARARWLDPALRLDGMFQPAEQMLREKIAWIDKFLSPSASVDTH